MNRRFESDWLLWRRRLNAGHVRTISMFLASFILFNIILYLSIKYVIYPIKISYTTEPTTIPTTTTTTTELTTLETTTEASFRAFSSSRRMIELIYFSCRSWMFFFCYTYHSRRWIEKIA